MARRASAVAAVSSALRLLLLTVAMMVLHLGTSAGRRAVRDIANRVLASVFRGRLEIGHVDKIDLRGDLVARDIRLFDPSGRIIADGVQLEAQPLVALWRGLRRAGDMPAAAVTVSDLWLLEGAYAPAPSYVDTFELRHPPAPSPATAPGGSRFHFPSLTVRVLRVHSDLAGVAIDASHARATGSLFTDPVVLRVGTFNALARLTRSPELQVSVDLDVHDVFVAATAADAARYAHFLDLSVLLIGDGVHCQFRYAQNDRDVEFSSSGCSATAGAADAFAQRALGLDVSVASFDARRHDADDWHIAARGAVNQQPFEGTLAASSASLVGDVVVPPPRSCTVCCQRCLNPTSTGLFT